MKSILVLFAILAALVGVASCVILRPAVYTAIQANRIFEKTTDADNVIGNYEWFKTQWQEIQSLERKARIAEQAVVQFEAAVGPRETWDFRTREESFRLAANLSGVRNVRSDAIAEYNARARMANRSIFMGRDVPDHIEP